MAAQQLPPLFFLPIWLPSVSLELEVLGGFIAVGKAPWIYLQISRSLGGQLSPS